MNFEDFDTAPVFAISVVAQLTGMHPQTLRQYDRVGLVTPQRTSGGGRRYSARDVERLREIQHLSGEGIGLTGVKRILDLEYHADQLKARVRQLEGDLEAAQRALAQLQRRTTPGTDVVLRDSAAVVVWRRPPHSSL
jgi:MerR family transcriptional regulator/heat shock protein HspR